MYDRIVVVDWSASSTPKRGADSIWIGVDDDRGGQLWNPSTRRAAAEAMRAATSDGASVLVGVDFSLGFPTGTAARLGRTGEPWRALWDLLADEVVDDADNRNNRFAVAASLNARVGDEPGPFWGCPPAAAGEHLTTTRPPTDDRAPSTWRIVEARLRRAGRRPFSVWQLLGAGAVGSQSLLGIPVIHGLLAELGPRGDVWPFTTGLVAPPAARGAVVLAEVWPSALPSEPSDGRPRDAAQVATVASWLRRLATDGDLDEAFTPRVDDATRRTVVSEEGWVLGVAADGSVVASAGDPARA